MKHHKLLSSYLLHAQGDPNMLIVMWRSFALESGGDGQDYVRATTCCLVLQRLLASRPCFESVRSMPEVITVLFQVLFLISLGSHIVYCSMTK